jgi:CubicO group peptidase (beta-lactamase class C family)
MEISTKYLVFFCFVSSVIALSNCELEPALQNAIDDLVQNEFFTRGKGAAIGLSIVKGDQVLYTNGYGQSDIENGIKADNSTLFNIASITKVKHRN